MLTAATPGCLFSPVGTGPIGRDADADASTDGEADAPTPTCEDGLQNGLESDTDCGGTDCPGCLNGQSCDYDRDCTSGYCHEGECFSSHCTDGDLTGDETDIDCGGRCDPCGTSRDCVDDEDCQSGVCDDGRCAPSACDDGVLNGLETDVDCGGGCEGCDNGRSCITSSDCHSLLCDDGSCRSAVSCDDLLGQAVGFEDGPYEIVPSEATGPVTVYCDMTTDDGGWTLVASSLHDTFNDRAIAYHDELRTIFPATSQTGVWNGLRDVLVGPSDIRFTCRVDAGGATMDVDLSFYATDWYQTITTGIDSDSCFNVRGSPQPAPARRNNLTNEFLEAGDPWNQGALIGEDQCNDRSDFTVDFDDQGMDSVERDGTDWGEDDDARKCGSRYTSTGAFFIWVRRPVWW